jgi:hypothetical protein
MRPFVPTNPRTFCPVCSLRTWKPRARFFMRPEVRLVNYSINRLHRNGDHIPSAQEKARMRQQIAGMCLGFVIRRDSESHADDKHLALCLSIRRFTLPSCPDNPTAVFPQKNALECCLEAVYPR